MLRELKRNAEYVFVFCHGFAFDKTFWQNLAPYFAGEKCIYLDLGYFGNSDNLHIDLQDNDKKYIGIGHSLGLTKLINLKQKFDYLIGLNGFINFLGNDHKLHKQRKLELKFLQNHFIKSPLEAINNFYKRCGVYDIVEFERIKNINIEVVLNDLQFLTHSFTIPCHGPTLIIGAKDDIIVPPEILYDNFTKLPNITLQILEKGKHGLGLLESHEISKRVMSFINGIDINQKQNQA